MITVLRACLFPQSKSAWKAERGKYTSSSGFICITVLDYLDLKSSYYSFECYCSDVENLKLQGKFCLFCVCLKFCFLFACRQLLYIPVCMPDDSYNYRRTPANQPLYAHAFLYRYAIQVCKDLWRPAISYADPFKLLYTLL